jgi:sodium transport system permease protein
MKGFLAVFRKEVVENARDRRTLASALLYGPLFGPVLFVSLISLVMTLERDRAEQTLNLPVAGAEHAPNLVRFLEQQGVKVRTAPDDVEEAVRRQDEDMVLRIPAEFPEAWRAGRPARVDLVFDGSRPQTQRPATRARDLLARYGQQVSAQRLQIRGIDPSLATPLAIADRDVSTARGRAAALLAVLPYFLILSAFVGGMYLAIDTTTGERERQSLEPLLANPVSREQIMLGKLGATTFYAMGSVILSVIAFAVSIRFLPQDALGLELSLSLAAIFWIALVTVPVALVAATVQTIVASFSRSFREAQTYLQFLIIIPAIPSILMAIHPVKTQAWMLATPLLGQTVLINQLARGEFPAWADMLIATVGTLVVSVICGWIAMRLYHRESLAVSV